MLEEILEYQKKDAQLFKIDTAIANSSAKKVVNQMVEVVKTAQKKLVELEKQAGDVLNDFKALEKKEKAQTKLVEKILKEKPEASSEEELKKLEDKLKDTTTELLLLQKNLKKLSKTMESTLANFEKTKNEVLQAKAKHKKGMEAYNNLVESHTEHKQKLEQELSQLEKKVDKKLMAKYKAMREDKTFPVFVPLANDSCGGCSMQIAMSKKHILDEKGLLECENCHRIIYKKI